MWLRLRNFCLKINSAIRQSWISLISIQPGTASFVNLDASIDANRNFWYFPSVFKIQSFYNIKLRASSLNLIKLTSCKLIFFFILKIWSQNFHNVFLLEIVLNFRLTQQEIIRENRRHLVYSSKLRLFSGWSSNERKTSQRSFRNLGASKKWRSDYSWRFDLIIH